MARLREEEESRVYDRMTRSPRLEETFALRFPGSTHVHLFPTSKADIGDADEITFKDINRQIAVIINVLVSVVACSAALWIAARHWTVPSRLGLSMGGSGLIGVAEVVVYAGYLRRVKEAKLKSKAEVETKEIVDTWVIGGNRRLETEKEPLSIDSQQSAARLRKRQISADNG